MAVNRLSVAANANLTAYLRDASGAELRKRFGAGGVPALDLALSYGTGSDQCSWLYYAERTVATATADNLDLSGSLTDAFGNVISATKLKLLIVAIEDPDGTKTIRVGPRGVSNAAQLKFGGTGATVYQDVTDWAVIVNDPVTGATITAGTGDVLGLYNPSAGSVTYHILMAGK